MWIGTFPSVEDPTSFTLKDCSRRPPSKIVITNSSKEIGDFFNGRSQLLLLAENEVLNMKQGFCF